MDDLIQKVNEVKIRFKNWKKVFSNEEILLIKKTLPFLDLDSVKFSEVKYCLLNDIFFLPKCPVCNETVKFSTSGVEYLTYCSKECSNSSIAKEIKNSKRKNTTKERYGVDNPSKLDRVKESISNARKFENDNKIYIIESDVFKIKDIVSYEKINIKKIKEKINKVDNIIPSVFTDDELRYIYDAKTFLNNNGSFSEYIYCIMNDINEIQLCPVCGNKLKLISNSKGYYKYCSRDCSSNCQEKVENQRKTMIENHGVSCGYLIPSVIDKSKKTMVDRYGVENIFQNKEFQRQCSNKSQTEEVKRKREKTNLERYGNTNNLQSEEVKRKREIARRKVFYPKFLVILSKKNITPLFDYDEYMNYDYSYKLKYKCDLCDNIIERENLDSIHVSCLNHANRSSGEFEIVDFLNENGITNIETNKRFYYTSKNYHEIDIYLDDYGIGIEFDGTYYHNDTRLDKMYHLAKTEFFKERGIRLIHIFDSDWINNRCIVESLLKTFLNKNKIIYARKCELKEISNSVYSDFCLLNHLQGSTNASIKYGLFHENELVQIMSFGKSRYNKKYDFELIRCCSKTNINVVGGFNKLFSYFVKNNPNKRIISYIDRRYFIGSGYINAGFKFLYNTEPNYFYFKSGSYDLKSRHEFQKHKLKDKLENFDENKTEYENMLNNNYFRIFDCGNMVFEYNT